MPGLSVTAKQVFTMAMKAEQAQQIEHTNDYPTRWYEQFTITAKGDLDYEETPNTENQSSQTRVAINELLAAGLIMVQSESEDKKRQRFRITDKGVEAYNKRPPEWVGRGDTWHKA